MRRSAFAASFLSLLFPGLGQAYAGAPWRGLLIAAPGILLLALVGGLVSDHATRLTLLNSLLDTNVLLALLVLDAVLLLYRLVAIVDAFRLAARTTAPRRARQEPAVRTPLPLRILSVAGLLAVLLVASGVHVAVAYYDRLAYDLITAVTSGGNESGTPSPSPSPSEEPSGAASASPTASPSPTPSGGRLNILLLGVDRRGNDVTFNTDTMIVLSIDPKTDQIAMLSLPRDTVNVPLPKSWPAYGYYGGTYPAKINSLWTRAVGSPALFPFPDAQRGAAALKGTLGALYGIDIPYYVEVDFDGFRRVVDTLGGVTVKVALPVQDDNYPLEFGRGSTRLYIPPTIQHMTGDQALAYARSRHGSNDFDRASRQQNVILSLREEADIPTILAHLTDLVDTLKTAVHTDIPTSMLPQLAGLAEQVGLQHVRSLVFAPPLYGRENCCSDPRGYLILPNIAAIRKAVNDVFSFDPALEASREKIASEGAKVQVLNGSGISGQALQVKDYLVYRGFDATIPTNGRTPTQNYANTVITVYNGAEANLPATIELLQQLFGVQVVTKSDPKVTVDIILITGTSTPKLVAPT